MNKQEFLEQLRKALPQADRDERLNFYSEMIDDRMEEGFSEEEAVSMIGPIDTILADIPQTRPEDVPKKKIKTWGIVLLVLGAPLWLPLLLAAVAVAFSLYVSIWSVIVSLWAAEVSLWGAAVGLGVSGIFSVTGGHNLVGVAVIGAGIVCAGLSIFLFFGCKAATKGATLLTKKLALVIKKERLE